MPLPLDAYIDTWHGEQAVQWIERYERAEPFFLFVGFPGPHDPWDAPQEAVDWYRDVEVSMPRTTRRPATGDSTGRYAGLLNGFLWLSDTETRVMLQLEVYPEGAVEKVGDVMGAVDRQVKGDLKRFKEFIESRGQETGGWRGQIESGEGSTG